MIHELSKIMLIGESLVWRQELVNDLVCHRFLAMNDILVSFAQITFPYKY